MFSIVLISKNEENTLPTLFKSIKEFKDKGGEVIVLDTGSTDNTVKVAKEFGCKVEEVGDRFIKTIKNADEINKRFIIDEEPIIKNGDKLFDFSEARNYAATLASNDWVFSPDCDEALTSFNLNEIEKAISDPNVDRLEYNFVYSHDQYGNEAIKFLHSKFYNRKKLKWVGIIHEVLSGVATRTFLDEDIIKLEHFQQPKSERGNYLPGLALDCFEHQNNDRNLHYLSRELLWTGRPKSAIKGFEKHIAMGKWKAERGQSMVFIGDAYGQLKDEEKQIEWYQKAFTLDGSRRESLMRLANLYYKKGDRQRTACYCSAALQIPWNGYYANQHQHYAQEPHELLYWALWESDREQSKYHWEKCLEYQPNNPKFIEDAKFYGLQFTGERVVPDKMENRPDVLSEHLERYNWAKPFTKGRKILDAACGTGYGKDILEAKEYRGVDISQEVIDYASEHYGEGFSIQDLEKIDLDYKPDIVVSFETIEHLKSPTKFLKWVRDNSKTLIFSIPIDNPSPFHKVVYSEQQAKDLIKKYFKEVILWKQKGFVCGIAFTINLPMVSIIVPTLNRPNKLKRLLETIDKMANYPSYEVIVKHDKFGKENKGAPKLVKEGVKESKGELVMFLGDDVIPQPDFLILAVLKMLEIPDGLVGLNDMYWHGEMATHWLASKKLLPLLDGEFFHTGYHHTGCDNELTERCRQVGKYVWAEESKVYHDHPIQMGYKKIDWDDTYKLAYRKDRMEHDRDLLKKRSQKLGFELRENFTKPKI